MNEHPFPDLRDFGITPEEWALYVWGELDKPTSARLTMGVFWSVFILTASAGFLWAGLDDAGPLIIAVLLGLGAAKLAAGRAALFKRQRLLKGVVGQRIERYEEAVQAYRSAQEKAKQVREEAKRIRREAEQARLRAQRTQRRKEHDYWMAMSGVEFEENVAELLRDLGYHVDTTPASGDAGVDLIVHKDAKRYIVQCKRYSRPVGVAVARELLGARVSGEVQADEAVLICTGGFTKQAREFAQTNGIWLVSIPGLMQWAGRWKI